MSKLSAVAKFPKDKIQKVWTSESCLQEFVDEVKAGKITPDAVVIFYLQTEANGNRTPHYWTQNCTHAEQIAFGHLLIGMAMDEWRNPK